MDELRKFVALLSSKDIRQNIVLIFYGTGVNFWHYFPFLRHFRLSELQEFRRIYGMSGASGAIWLYSLEQMGMLKEDKVRSADLLLKKHMNKKNLFGRLYSIAIGRYVYRTADLLNFISEMITEDASKQATLEGVFSG